MSLGKASYCICVLIEKGFAKAENYRRSDDKLGYVHLLTPSGILAKADFTRQFLDEKMQEYERLRLQIEELVRTCAPPVSEDTFVVEDS